MPDYQWILIRQLPLELDLMPLLKHLTVLNIACHVSEADNQQQLHIRNQDNIEQVNTILNQWLAGELEIKDPQAFRQTPKITVNKIAFIRALPVTLITMLLGVIGALLVSLDRQSLSLAEPFLFQPWEQNFPEPFLSGMQRGEYWRLITPMFLHFGIVHIVFNNLLVWLIGHRIELVKGSLHLFIVLFLTGIMANVIQFILTPQAIFGGLSGAAYGLAGYIMVYQRIVNHPILFFPTSMLVILMLSLLLGIFGIALD